MRVLIQRVTRASVSVDGNVFSRIGAGYVVLIGVFDGDTAKEAAFLAEKTVQLRVMSDGHGKMNRSLLDLQGEVLVVSQFTLCADVTGGRRPSFLRAAQPAIARTLYEHYIEKLRELGVSNVVTGEFGAEMQVELVNDGPVTIFFDTSEWKSS